MKNIDYLNLDVEAIVLGNGEFPTHEIPLKVLYSGKPVICCDGGANEYIRRGNIPNLIIGDGDSLEKEYYEKYNDLVLVIDDQETNDQTKAVNYLLSKGINNIVIVGATGKRDDHILGNISLLMEYRQAGANIKMLTDHGVFIPCHNKFSMRCLPGLQISIFNFAATDFSSIGLKYPIYDFTSLWQGTLNESVDNQFTINAKGEYLLFITYSPKLSI